MSIISLTIEESEDQKIWGIPRSISITASLPCSIFYTLDGTPPTQFSEIYVEPILLPTDKPAVVLKVFATNGVDTSPIITEEYPQPSQLDGIRRSPALTDAKPNQPSILTAFGSMTNVVPQPLFFNIAGAGSYSIEGEPGYVNALDADGNPDDISQKELIFPNYEIKENHTNSKFESMPGTLPQVDFKLPAPIPDETYMYRSNFDPRARVIYVDVDQETVDSPTCIVSTDFSMTTPMNSTERMKLYHTSGNAPPPSTNYINSHFNPNDNTVTHYFHDSTSNKWLMMKSKNTAYDPANSPLLKSGFSPGRNSKVYTWIPFPTSKTFF